MIKPKHTFGKKCFEINEEFIDRTEAKALYREKLEHNDKQYNIIAFYGVGGIGKSKLRREICRMHREENEEGISFYLDLNSADDRNLGMGILKLVDSCDAGIDFRCFEMAYALYFRKKHPGTSYGRERELVTDSTLVGIGLNIVGIFDNGLMGTTAEIVERSIRAIANRTIDKDVKEELKHFDEYTVAEMEERLPLFFQYDLHSYLEKHPKAKVIIVFDTFEALNENVLERVHRSRNERWVQEIIEYFDSETFPKLLTIIFGREEIEWDDDWQEMISQYQLREFTADYSREYLQRVGIEEEGIVKRIMNSSKGYPFLLYLSAETYANIKNAGKEPSIEDFGGSHPKIIERFIYNLDKDTVEVLRLMSVPNYYNNEIFEMLIKAYNVSFPMTEYEQFNKYSFVSYDEKESEYHIHDLMRKGILEKTSGEMVRSAHSRLLDYFSDKLCGRAINKYVLEMFYHARLCMTCEEFNEWLRHPVDDETMSPLDMLRLQQTRGEQGILMQIINGVLATFSLSDMLIDFVNIYIDIVHLGGDYERAVTICGEYLGQFSKEEIYEDEQLIKMRIRKIHHSMFILPVDGLIAEAEQLLEGVDISRFPEEYNELLFLLGGNLGVLSGRFDYASDWLEMSMAYAKKNNLEAFVHRTVRKQADILLEQGRCDEAIELLEPIVNVNTPLEAVDSRYKIYLMGVLGECYRKKNDPESAWRCYDVVEKKTTENHMPGWQAHSYLAKGMIRILEKEYADAADFFDRALSIYRKINQKWGIINTNEAMLLMRKAESGSLLRTDIEECIAFSEKMNYRYNESVAKKLLVGEDPYLQLFFL